MKEYTYILQDEKVVKQFDGFMDIIDAVFVARAFGIKGRFQIEQVWENDISIVKSIIFVNDNNAIVGEVFPLTLSLNKH